jgi:succinate dehydrogenase (or fumarate reductase) cytochrome b subunit, b558 family
MKNKILLSSITKKVVMAISGAGFVLFLLFHGIMNFVSILSPDGYDLICEILGANWYAVVATLILAGLVGLHVLLAFILSLENLIARGKNRYMVYKRPKGVAWSSQNMLIFGLLILGGLGLHLYDFWYKMQFAELMGDAPVNGMDQIRFIFSHSYFSIMYLLWLVVLWFHLSHGVWSMLQSVGWNSQLWKKRWQVIGEILATIIVLLFASVVVYYWLIYPNVF